MDSGGVCKILGSAAMASAVVEKMAPYQAMAKEVGAELYDPETRPKKLTEWMLAVGADKVLSRVVSEAKAEMLVEGIASVTTLEGFQAKKAEAIEE